MGHDFSKGVINEGWYDKEVGRLLKDVKKGNRKRKIVSDQSGFKRFLTWTILNIS